MATATATKSLPDAADMRAQLPKIIAVSFGGLALAGLLALQAASSTLTRKSPEVAAQLMPLNGLAQEQVATRQFMAGVETAGDIAPSATAASAIAREAFGHDPLSPKSFAILAMAETDAAKKRALLGAASAINRRDLLLQGLVLEDRVAQKDYAGTLETFDMILRVHPEQRANFFPILLQALSEDEALPALSGILDQESEWQEGFFAFAVRQPSVLANLAKLRLARESAAGDVDQRLIAGLAKSGQTELAYQVYRAASSEPPLSSGERALIGWSSELAPFDWELADEAGFRAQLSPSQADLEVFVRGGEGGVLARRNLALPPGPFALRLSHDLSPADQVEDVRLQLGCPGAETPFFDQPLRIGIRDYRTAGAPAGCDFVQITIHARAWTGKDTIRGTISKLELVRE